MKSPVQFDQQSMNLAIALNYTKDLKNLHIR
jgi:hypothetical protein